MSIWPIEKLREIFYSIDTQLRIEREKQEDMLRRIDELGQHVQQLEERAQQTEKYLEQQLADVEYCFKEHQQDKLNDHWMTKFGYDSLISNLQLAIVEQQVMGNRARLEALRDTHKGETCFVIGNGPSLRAEDLTRLHQAGIFCFGSKRITAIFGDTPWRPDVWGVSDLGFISLYHEEMNALQGFSKLVPCQSIINLNLPIQDAIYFPFIQTERTPCWFNADVTRGVHFWGTITCKLINFAVYMGFTKIYLLGVDHSYGIKYVNGVPVYDSSAQNHFSKSYISDVAEKQLEKTILDMKKSLEYMTNGFHAVKWYCDHAGVEIVNATRGGELEVFPRLKFDELIEIL